MQNFNSQKLSLSMIEQASKGLKGVVKDTSLIYSSYYSRHYNNRVYLKPENLQFTGSYKLRGAYNKILSLSQAEMQQGIIASSAGNHAQGVAYAASKLGVKAVIVMPRNTPLIKVEATKKYGAEVVLYGEVYDDAYAEAKRLEEEHNYTFVHPFNDCHIMAGQGTVGLEIVNQLPDADIVLVPVGGGGLISGVAVACKTINPGVRVIGVEPSGANAMAMSLRKGSIYQLNSVNTIADGVAVRAVGDKTYEVVKEYVDEVITVSEYEIMEAFLELLENHKLVGEPAGVLTLAALNKLNVKGKNIVSVISGGNIDVDTVSSMISKGLISRGRLFSFSVFLPDKPQELMKISDILFKSNANILKLDHTKCVSPEKFEYVNLAVTIKTNGQEHVSEILSLLKRNNYEVSYGTSFN